MPLNGTSIILIGPNGLRMLPQYSISKLIFNSYKLPTSQLALRELLSELKRIKPKLPRSRLLSKDATEQFRIANGTKEVLLILLNPMLTINGPLKLPALNVMTKLCSSRPRTGTSVLRDLNQQIT